MTPNFLSVPQPPWVALLVLKQGQRYRRLIQLPENFALRVVDGKKCRSKPELLKEFARALDFPPYFGRNWDGFEECLTDLEWLPASGYLVVVTGAERVLEHSPEDYETLLLILRRAGEEWAVRPPSGRFPAPFHTLFVVSEQRKGLKKEWGLPEIQSNRLSG
jgi:RNAse (barnase) inhibitor barstar